MKIRQTQLAAGAAALAIGVAPFAVLADDRSSAQSHCSQKMNRTYGFVCQGFVQVVPGAGLEPVSQVGIQQGSPTGVFEGYATLSASIGSVRQRASGQAVFHDRTCFAQIRYRVWLVLPNGALGPELPPLDADFVVVDGGKEVLGAPNNFAGNGADVPRMTCRLVETR